MDFLIKLTKNMVIQIVGNIFIKLLIIYLLDQLLMDPFYAFMVVCLQIFLQLTNWDLLIENKKYHMRDQWLISCGLILKIFKLGKEMQEVQDGFSDIKSLTTLIYLMELT